MLPNPFPLLGKDLNELANRRSLYWVRTLYATVLFGIGLYILFGGDALNAVGSGGILGLGTGGPLFSQLVFVQVIAILLFMPALTASVITTEKERETLLLLLITPLSPMSIVIQKLLGRVVPLLCYLALSFPLLAVAYSRGGVNTLDLIGSMIFLVVLVIQVASLGVMCSAWCRTSVEAFFATYLALALSTFCCPFNMMWLQILTTAELKPGHMVFGSMISLVLSGVCLIAAQIWLVQRAFVPARNWLLIGFQKVDGVFTEMNQVTGGVVLVNDSHELPETRPIAWRETSRKSLGTFRYLFRVLVALEVPVVIALQMTRVSSIESSSTTTSLLYLLWLISLTLVCIHAAGVVSSERTRQTLESLLTIPLTGRDILLQKISGVRRLIQVLLVPFFTIFVTHHWIRAYGWDVRYLLLSGGCAVILLWTAAWYSFWVGLRVRSQMRAVMLSLLAVCLVAVLPTWGGGLLEEMLDDWWGIDASPFLQYVPDPALLVGQLETWYGEQYPSNYYLDSGFPWPLTWSALAQLSFFAVAGLGLRTYCLVYADRLLGRVGEGDKIPETAGKEEAA